jgi:CheY-like chemotaxis protein
LIEATAIMENLDTDAFEQQVRECLLHLFDYLFLQDHPLVHACVPEAKGDASRIQAFRQMVTDAIESLKPDTGVTPDSRKTRLYQILQMRYLSQQQLQHILHRLNLSERQFYRDHAKAVQTVSYILAEQIKQPLVLPTAPTSSISLQSEIELVHRQGEPQQINGLEFLHKTLHAIQGLIDRHQAHIEITATNPRLDLSMDLTVLRQAIIWIMSQLVTHSPSGSRFVVSLNLTGSHYQFTFERETDDEMAWRPIPQTDTLATLVTALSGQLLQDDEGITLEVPLEQQSILIIDDNPDAVALFRRYLAGYPYQVLAAHDGTQAIELATNAQPRLIVLDVMLPKQDGWEVLQLLKNRRSTAHIPILICSVLDAADLALSVGADGFLKKPPGEATFLDALARHLNPDPQSI